MLSLIAEMFTYPFMVRALCMGVLVALCAAYQIPVVSIPGCCAAVTALALSALTTGRFAFEGFITTNRHDRRERLTALKYEERTMIFYEAPHKLRQTLDDILEFMGDRKITLCREMTKLNEEIMRTTLGEAVEIYNEREPKGEYVLIIEGASPKAKADDGRSPRERVADYISGGMDKKEAVKLVAKEMGVPKNVVYSETLDL